MRFRDIFSYSFGAVRKRKLRAGLTTLGVVIGITAIVAFMTLGQGFENEIGQQFQTGFSTDTLIVSAGGFDPTQGSDFDLYVNDSGTIAGLDNVNSVVAILQKGVILQIGDKQITAAIIGVNYTNYAAIYSTTFTASQGAIPTASDNNSIVIGWNLHDPYANGTTLLTVNDSVSVV